MSEESRGYRDLTIVFSVFMLITMPLILIENRLKNKNIQWEYACYKAKIIEYNTNRDTKITYTWSDPSGSYVTDSVGEIWHRTGCDFAPGRGSKNLWFNYLGEQGWELVSADDRYSYSDMKAYDAAITDESFRFKRRKTKSWKYTFWP